MWLIVGLGNPGSKYALTRHNIGFMLLDCWAEQQAISWSSDKNCYHTKTTISEQKTLLVKPQTFMNLSGKVIPKWLQYYKVPAEQILVVHDDIDLEFGRTKLKIAGGHGGHNGLRSIDQEIGKNYWRLRLGVGRSAGQLDAAAHVLANFIDTEQQQLASWFEKITNLLPLIFNGDSDKFSSLISQSD